MSSSSARSLGVQVQKLFNDDRVKLVLYFLICRGSASIPELFDFFSAQTTTVLAFPLGNIHDWIKKLQSHALVEFVETENSKKGRGRPSAIYRATPLGRTALEAYLNATATHRTPWPFPP